jgi:hypothetical protein
MKGGCLRQSARSRGDAATEFADSLAVFAAPKRIGLKSYMQLWAVPIKFLLITLPDVSTHLRPD